MAAARAVPDASTIVVERVRDELGDWRVCVLSPRGGRIHAPWAMAAAAKIREETGIDVETLWGDDGFVVRFPDVDQPPDPRLLLPDPDEVQALVVRQLGATALFAAKFRENAARSLLLPKRRPGMRAPLWQQRKRAADLLAVAVALRIVSGAARNLSRVPARLLRHAGARRDARRRPQPEASASPRSIRTRRRRLRRRCSSATSRASSTTATRRSPSAARRRWPSIRRSCASCSATPSCASCSTPTSMDAIERQLQRLDPQYHAQERRRRARHAAVARRSHATTRLPRARSAPDVAASVAALVRGAARAAGADRRRAALHRRRGRGALSATRSACRCRPAFPNRCSQPVRDPLGDLALRYARTHAPFTAADFAARYGLHAAAAEARADAADRRGPAARRRVPARRHAARMDRRRRAAHAAPPLARQAAARDRAGRSGGARPVRHDLAGDRQAAARRRRAARRHRAAAGRAAAGVDSRDRDPAGAHRGLRSGRSRRGHRRRAKWSGSASSRSASATAASRCTSPIICRGCCRPQTTVRRRPARRQARTVEADLPIDRETAILDALRAHGASFFGPLHEAVGGGYPGRNRRRAVESGLAGPGHQRHVPRAARVHARARAAAQGRRARPTCRRSARGASRRRRPKDDGRWCRRAGVATARPSARATETRPRRARNGPPPSTQQLLARHGVLTREAVTAEAVPGGFGADLSGAERRWRRAAGSGAAISSPASAPRSSRCPARSICCARCATQPDEPEVAVLAATDPANPVRRDAEVACATPSQSSRARRQGFAASPRLCGRRGRRARAHAIGRRHGDSRQRRAGRVSGARRSAARRRSCPSRSPSDRRPAAPSRAC